MVCNSTENMIQCAYINNYIQYDFTMHPDINECTSGQDQCEHNCWNTVGSYTCSCRAGYRLDNYNGRSCHGVYFHCPLENWIQCTCIIVVFIMHPDINECANGQDQCQQNCQNTVGSYTCSCRAGYRLDNFYYGRSCYGV